MGRASTRTECLSLATAAGARLRQKNAVSLAISRSARILQDHGWSALIKRTRDEQWRTYLAYCDAESRVAVPITEAHLAAFIGWLTEERESNRLLVGASSLPQ